MLRRLRMWLLAGGLLAMAAGIWFWKIVPEPAPMPAGEEEALPEKKTGPGAAQRPPFNTGKYTSEPVIKVWLSEKDYIESIALERYLEGVVAREMDPGWPLAALAAQAVAARTLTLHAIEAGTIRRLHQADVSTAKEELQAYAPELVTDNVRQAVRQTRGQILLHQGSLVNAIYSACDGQISAAREESFPAEPETPYFQPVTDNCFKYAPAALQSWTVKVSGREVAAAAGWKGDPAQIAILSYGPSGRVLTIGAGTNAVSGPAFRRALGYDRLKSTLIYEMRYDGESFIFSGRGWGSGAGLCQWGAYAFACDGWTAEEILQHYYTGAEVKKIWE